MHEGDEQSSAVGGDELLKVTENVDGRLNRVLEISN